QGFPFPSRSRRARELALEVPELEAAPLRGGGFRWERTGFRSNVRRITMAQMVVTGDVAKLANGALGKVTKRASAPPPPPKAKAVKAKKATSRGLSFERRYTQRGSDPLDHVTWERRSSIITNPDGSIVFKMEGAEIPAGWSQLATDIVVSKYFRKAGLH